MPEINVNTMIWEILMSATMRAAVHLGQDYQDNIRATKNTDFEKFQAIVRYFSQKLILDRSRE